MDQAFTDLLVRIRKGIRAGYRVEAWLSDGSFYEGAMRLTTARLQELLASGDLPEQYGSELFRALFDGPVATAYDVATGLARQQSVESLRVRLFLDDSLPGEVHALKWERLVGPAGRPLAVSALTPLSRYVALSRPEPLPLDEPLVRLLFVISAPKNLAGQNLAPIRAEDQACLLLEGLRAVSRSERCEMTLMPGQSGVSDPLLRAQLTEAGWSIIDGHTTLDAIVEHLPGQHVLHFLGHGQFLAGAGWLGLEDAAGELDWVKEDVLTAQLSTASLQLVFLAACESAARGASDPQRRKSPPAREGLAAALVRSAQVPAVVAMQEQVRADAAYRLTGEFYRRLFLEHGLVDRALNEARATLFDRREPDWATPVLYMRIKSGQLARPNPVWAALRAIREHRDYVTFAKKAYIPLPIEAVRVSPGQNPRVYEQQEVQSVGTVDLIEASLKHLRISHRIAANPTSAPLVLILGGPGASKSMLTRRLGWETLQEKTASNADDQFLPLYLDLQDYRPGSLDATDALAAQVLEKLRGFMPGVEADSLEQLSQTLPQVRLRILLNAGDTLPEVGRDLVRQAASLAASYPRHQYVLAVQPGALVWDDLGTCGEEQPCVLAIQPLTRRGIRHLLETQDGYGSALLDVLYNSSLFDLAGTPFLLTKMIANARQNQFTTSRSLFLQKIIDEAVAQISPEQGMRANAARTLYAMAWHMQQNEIAVWPIGDAFRKMGELRAGRGYAVEALYAALVRQRLLLAVGEDALRFSYGSVQGHCCAQAILALPERDDILHDLVSSLGSPLRIRWWEETLVAATGLLAVDGAQAAREALEGLLKAIVYGADLLEGTRVFLAARCLLECRWAARQGGCSDELVEQVVNALRWRSDSAFEADLGRRLQATQLLAQLGLPQVAVGLAAKAYGRVRKNVADQWDYEFSTVRFAAAVALKRMNRGEAEAALAQMDPRLIDLFRAWQEKDLNGLIEQSMVSEDAGVQSLAALALGDLQGPLEACDVMDGARALDRLIDMFTGGETPQAIRWSVADALSLVDSAVVTEALVNPLLERAHLARVRNTGETGQDQEDAGLPDRSATARG